MAASQVPGFIGRDSVLRLQEALDLRALRQAALNENVANADTPGWVARDVLFRATMEKAAGQEQVALTRTDGQHQGAGRSAPAPVWEFEGPVDIVVEMARLAENAGAYRATASVLRSRLSQLMSAASDGRRA